MSSEAMPRRADRGTDARQAFDEETAPGDGADRSTDGRWRSNPQGESIALPSIGFIGSAVPVIYITESGISGLGPSRQG